MQIVVLLLLLLLLLLFLMYRSSMWLVIFCACSILVRTHPEYGGKKTQLYNIFFNSELLLQ